MATNIINKAYCIAGHGGELEGTFEVPKGCIIVASMHSGESSLDPEINQLCKIDPTYLKNPIKYSSEIMDKLKNKSFEIYKEGDECPNFQYELLNMFDLNDRVSYPTNLFRLESGVLDLLRLNCNVNRNGTYHIPVPPQNWSFYTFANYFANMYTNSIFPTRKEVYDKVSKFILGGYRLNESNISELGFSPLELEEIQKKHEKIFKNYYLRPESIYDLYKYITNKNPSLFTTTQFELCRDKPGVYYNFVCRDNLNSNTVRIGKKISSAILRRKPLIRNYYNIYKHLPPPEINDNSESLSSENSEPLYPIESSINSSGGYRKSRKLRKHTKRCKCKNKSRRNKTRKF